MVSDPRCTAEEEKRWPRSESGSGATYKCSTIATTAGRTNDSNAHNHMHHWQALGEPLPDHNDVKWMTTCRPRCYGHLWHLRQLANAIQLGRPASPTAQALWPLPNSRHRAPPIPQMTVKRSWRLGHPAAQTLRQFRGSDPAVARADAIAAHAAGEGL